MASAFDMMDRRFRQPAPIKAEPLAEGAQCPDPKCRGYMHKPFSLCSCPSCLQIDLACDHCGWKQIQEEAR